MNKNSVNLAIKIAMLKLLVLVGAVQAEISVVDGVGNVVSLEQPATRIVSLAPHLTEQVFSAGAGDKLVGVVNYSDYPEQAKKLPVIGSYEKVSFESLVGLMPDLVLAWDSSGGEQLIARMKTLGFKVYVSKSKRIPEIAKSIRDIGTLSGTADVSEKTAEDFLKTYHRLVKENENKTPLKVFYQLWHKPIMTTNNSHTISNALEVCGGDNVFADAIPVIPRIGVESVVRRNPEVIIASGMGKESPEWLQEWRRWPDMNAVKVGALYSVPPDLLHRHSVRLLLGVELLCNHFDDARVRYNSNQVTSVGTTK